MGGLDWRIVAAAGEVLKTPLAGAGRSNPYCASFKAADAAINDLSSRLVPLLVG
jgi:hypothetical protein